MDGYYKIQNVNTGKFLTADYASTDLRNSCDYATSPALNGDESKLQKWRITKDFCTISPVPGEIVYSLNAVFKPWNALRKGSEYIIETAGNCWSLKDFYKQGWLSDYNDQPLRTSANENEPGTLWTFVRIEHTPMITEINKSSLQNGIKKD